MEITKSVSDLGVAAYLLMHGYEVSGKKGRTVFFIVESDTEDGLEEDTKKFDKLTMEYLSSTYHRFDACLMSLKKIPDQLHKR
jgi:hypothetical protein